MLAAHIMSPVADCVETWNTTHTRLWIPIALRIVHVLFNYTLCYRITVDCLSACNQIAHTNNMGSERTQWRGHRRQFWEFEPPTVLYCHSWNLQKKRRKRNLGYPLHCHRVHFNFLLITWWYVHLHWQNAAFWPCDRRTDRHQTLAYTALCLFVAHASRGKKNSAQNAPE